MNKKDLIDLVVVRTPGTPAEHRDIRMRLERMSTGDLEKIAAGFALAAIREEALNSPEVIKRQQELEEIEEQVRRQREDAYMSHAASVLMRVFSTPVNGRVAIDNAANRDIIESWVQEDQGESISATWFQKVLKENPSLANQLSWQSADVLDPAKRKQAEAAQAEKDREIFNAFARSHGFSEVEANYLLAKSVLGDGLDRYTLAQAVQSNALQLAPASQEDLAQFRQDAAEERQDFLINRATPLELRQAARYESEQLRGQQQHAARQVQIREQKEAGVGYPPLPNEAQDGQAIDRMFLLRLPKELYARFCSKYGFAAITARLNGVVKGE